MITYGALALPSRYRQHLVVLSVEGIIQWRRWRRLGRGAVTVAVVSGVATQPEQSGTYGSRVWQRATLFCSPECRVQLGEERRDNS